MRGAYGNEMGNGNKVKDYEGTLDMLVVALCRDYERRRRILQDPKTAFRTAAELRYINFKIHDATLEIVGEEDAELYIKEIGERIGYAYSAVSDVCERTYKTRKRAVMTNIAKRLHLSD